MRWAILWAMLVLASGAAADDVRTVTVKTVAAAVVLADRCPSLTIERGRLAALHESVGLAEADVRPGGSMADVARQAVAEWQRSFAELDRQAACQMAIREFGPAGTVAPGLLVPAR